MVLLGNPLPPLLMSSAASSFIIMFLSVSLLSFIKPLHRLALSLFALGACRWCSTSSLTSRIELLRFILAVSSFVTFLIPHFFRRCATYTLATLIGRSVDFSFDLSVSFSRYISRLSTSRQQFHNHHGGEISGFRSSFPSFLFPFTRYSFASWRAAIRAHDE